MTRQKDNNSQRRDKSRKRTRRGVPGENIPQDLQASPSPPGAPRQPALKPADEVEEASEESFPASDAPGYGTGHA